MQAAKPGSGKTCIDCHKGITHELPAGAEEFME
jgi:cytochrome c-type protein NapC